jgi:predicted  nucleic acid-binding Zn-ribbon protein
MPKESLDNVNVEQRLESPRSRGVQRQDVWDAADAVLLQGDKPTIERVRQHIGSGSPNTVGPHLEQWFRHLGRRINDPGTFATPHGVPDPVLQAAQHLWETALAQTRSDFDERLQESLKESASAVEAEKERAELAAAAADEATAKALRLESALDEMGPVLSQAREDLAAQRARLDEVRSAWALANNRLKEEREDWTREVAEIKRQLLSAVDRADAADRRVALELDRERTTRARAERQAEALQKSLGAAQAAALAASEHARQTQKDLGEREDSLKVHLATAVTELNEERQRGKDLRADCAVKALEASEARAQAKGLQHSLDRLSKLVQGDRPERWRAAKTFVPKKKI